ncbi:MAG TPA: VWA domain-containing protein [Vicinamibacterales bacterium]|nr:VWA domain-containing protein [Vicinamibacterales bacterium]
MTRRWLGSIGLAVVAGSMIAPVRGRAQQPAFRTAAEALAVDVNVLDGSGTPVTGLGTSDFDVRVDGRQRRVINVQWIANGITLPATAAPLQRVPDGYASNQSPTHQSGHLIVIAVDELNLPPGALSNMQQAVGGFIDRIAEANPVAVVGLGVRSATTNFTTDRDRLKKAVALMRGQQTSTSNVGGFFDMGLSVALRISQGDNDLVEAMIRRDCTIRRDDVLGRERCADEIRTAANLIVQNAAQEGQTTESRLRDLLTGLRGIDAPKTLVLVSQGFFIDGGASRIDQLASLAAAAQTTIYGLAVDEGAFARRRAMVGGVSNADRLERIRSLENLTSASRGTFLTLTGNGAPVLERVARELSGYYLLGVESEPADSDGRPHGLRVGVSRAGATVRARRSFVRSGAAADPDRSPRQRAAAALQAPIPAVGLPLRAIAIAFRDADRSKVQLLVHAEVGENYVTPQNIAIGFTVTDQEGRVVGGQLGVASLAPAVAGRPSPLSYAAGANVFPGDYSVKVAAADGDRAGSVEWTVHAGLLDLEGATSTALVAGGPVLPIDLLRPTVDSRVATGTIHGYFEVYGPSARDFTSTLEIAADEHAPALAAGEVTPAHVGTDRAIFSRTLNVESLPPGIYMLRAVVHRDDRVQRMLTRAFEVVGATAAADRANTTATAPRFLPVDPARLERPFDRAQLLQPLTLQRFRDLVGPPARAAFDQGVAQYQNGAYTDAAASFKRAVRPDVDPTAPLAYLAATYASQGLDAEAANIWRTALLAGSDVPEIHVWLADALVRRKAIVEAQALLEEAVTRWPADRRFLRLLGILYAMSGRGGEAADLVNRAIASNPDDVESLALALEWLYTVTRDGQAFHSRSEDVQRARTYAAQYLKIGGPDGPLVRRWQAYFDAQTP